MRSGSKTIYNLKYKMAAVCPAEADVAIVVIGRHNGQRRCERVSLLFFFSSFQSVAVPEVLLRVLLLDARDTQAAGFAD